MIGNFARYNTRTRSIEFRFDAVEASLPVLTGGELADWNARYAARVVQWLDEYGALEQLPAERSSVARAFDVMEDSNRMLVEALYAYDSQFRLPPVDVLDVNLTDEQVYMLVKLMVDQSSRA